jgi:hypothetical protein
MDPSAFKPPSFADPAVKKQGCESWKNERSQAEPGN